MPTEQPQPSPIATIEGAEFARTLYQQVPQDIRQAFDEMCAAWPTIPPAQITDHTVYTFEVLANGMLAPYGLAVRAVILNGTEVQIEIKEAHNGN